jgi:hypothetical protein
MPTQNHTTGLGGLQRGLGAFADQAPLFLGEGGVDVQHEWVGVGAPGRGEERRMICRAPQEALAALNDAAKTRWAMVPDRS